MLQQEEQNDQLKGLRMQLKVLSIATSALAFIVLILVFRATGHKPGGDSGWPDLAAGNLQVKRLILMSDAGKEVAVFATIDGRPRLALLDETGEVRLLLSEREDGGHISFSGDKEGQDTELKNGSFLIGNDKAGGILLEGPPLSRSRIEVLDSSGFSTQIGQSYLTNHADGTFSVTSAAAIVESSKDSTSTWTLINHPSIPPPATPGTAGSTSGAVQKHAPPSSNRKN